MASIVKELVNSVNNNPAHRYNSHSICWNIGEAVRKAIRRCQKHFDNGLGYQLAQIGQYMSAYPGKDIFEDSLFKESNYNEIANERIPLGNPSWSILNQSGAYRLLSIATEIVMYGVDETLNNHIKDDEIGPIWAPVIKFGERRKEKLIVIDRREIESYMAVYRLLNKAVQSDPERPLSIAIFGPPGSGKSFVVKEILNSIPEKIRPEFLTFNMAQQTNPEQLDAKLQDIRDRLVENKKVCLFIDEFDCELNNKNLGWLKYFLSPMEDWKKIHRTDSCPIFIFAGGTSPNYRDFTREDSSLVEEEQRVQFAMAKGPDFVSRLNGHINILGPNPVDDYDETFVLRKAIVLRSMILSNAGIKEKGQKLETLIDEKIVKAMLITTSYKHGMRSIRAILDMSIKIGGQSGKYVSGTLPSLSQLNMHLDGKAFMDRINEPRR